jgi:hypothetical protein
MKGYILVPGFMAQVQMCMKSNEEPGSSHGEVERFKLVMVKIENHPSSLLKTNSGRTFDKMWD